MKSELELYELLQKAIKQFEDTDWNDGIVTVIEVSDAFKERLSIE